MLPLVNTALAGRAPFRRSVDSLRAEGVKILLGPVASSRTRPAPAAARSKATPPHLGLDEAERMLVPAPASP